MPGLARSTQHLSTWCSTAIRSLSLTCYVLFIRTERLGIVTGRNVTGAPDLVVEVLSESTRDMDLGRKLCAYGRHDGGKYWAVDPDTNTVQVFHREGADFVDKGAFGAGDELVFLGTTLKIADIMA